VDNLSMECFSRVIRLHRKVLHRSRRHLSELGFAWNQYSVMKNISPGEALTLSEISARSFKVNSNVTGLVDFLEQKGVVMRVNDPVDRRVVRVKLTDEGIKIRKEVLIKQEEFIVEMFSKISDDEKTAFINSANNVLNGLN